MALLNNWDEEKIIRKDKIIEFEFLDECGYIEEIENGYYFLKTDFSEVEKAFYEEKNAELADELNLKDVQKEINSFIKKLKSYNRAKDIAESLLGKIAELKGITMKEIHEEMGLSMSEKDT